MSTFYSNHKVVGITKRDRLYDCIVSCDIETLRDGSKRFIIKCENDKVFEIFNPCVVEYQPLKKIDLYEILK